MSCSFPVAIRRSDASTGLDQGIGFSDADLPSYSTEQFHFNRSARQAKIPSYVSKNGAERTNLQRIMGWNCDVMLMAGKRRRESHVAPRLTSYLVAITAKQRRKMTAGEIARQFQARMTSSLTM